MSLLKVNNLTKEFGGVRAIDDLSFTINPGTIHSIIGPNGAGKTTLFNLITGVYTPTTGSVIYDNEAVTGFKSYELAERGMSRTFQNLQIFFNMTAVENVMVGAHLHLNRSFLASFFGLKMIKTGDASCRETCLELLDFVGLLQYADTDTESMPYGALKRLEIARALATKPKILLLDEPAAGLNPAESREIDQVIKKVAARGITVVLVEHDMKMVMEISDHILVLDYGRKLTEGSALEVRNNPDVIAAYLGGG
jgi:branched-chain amino acid transport system ATP-binding protein